MPSVVCTVHTEGEGGACHIFSQATRLYRYVVSNLVKRAACALAAAMAQVTMAGKDVTSIAALIHGLVF